LKFGRTRLTSGCPAKTRLILLWRGASVDHAAVSRPPEEEIVATVASPDTSLGPRIAWPSLLRQAAAGVLFGYFVLHPASMVIFQWLDPRMAGAMPDGIWAGFSGPIARSFDGDHFPKGIVFGMIAGLIAAIYAHHRLALTRQRDRLVEELRRREELHRRLASHLERLVQKNEELARLELANRRATQFMAHDFKTALNCIRGFSHELLEKPALREDPETVGALVCIRRQAQRMLGSVCDLLQLARVRQRHDPPREAVSVAAVLHEAVSDFSLPAHAEQIVLGGHYPDCPPVWANPPLLQRVVCNLISNALKHNGPGTRVWLDAQVDEGGGEVVFSCRDNGAGVPPEILPSLFEEFATSGDLAGGSTGLGLAFCKAAIEAHGGRIWCANSPRGAQFSFTIPLAQSLSQDRSPPALLPATGARAEGLGVGSQEYGHE
jgi:signal transduction histidine kinase